MQKVEVLLSCGCIKTVEIEAAVFAPRPKSGMRCENHGNQTIVKVGTPYHVSIGIKTNLDPNQREIE